MTGVSYDSYTQPTTRGPQQPSCTTARTFSCVEKYLPRGQIGHRVPNEVLCNKGGESTEGHPVDPVVWQGLR